MTTAVLFVSHSAELNGAELMLLNLIKELDRTKFRPVLITPRNGPLKDEAVKCRCESLTIPMKWRLTERANIWKQPLSWAFNLRSIRLIAQAAAEKNIRLIFSNSASVFSGSLAAKRLNVPHVWSIHEILAGDQPILFYILGRKNLVRLISRSSCCVIVNSEASRRPFEEYPNIRVVYNGIPFEGKGPRDRTEAKKALGLSHDDLTLGIIGKIYAGKGQKEVILAVERLRRSLPSIKLFIIGAVKNRRYYRELERLIHQYSIQDRIFFTGQIPDVFKYLKAFDLLIVASRVESFGRTAVEAMAAGTPVLALKAGGLPEIISHKQNGYLMDSADPDTIQSAVESVFKDPALTSDIVKNGLQTYKERFSLEKHVRQVEDIFDMCLRGKRDHA